MRVRTVVLVWLAGGAAAACTVDAPYYTALDAHSASDAPIVDAEPGVPAYAFVYASEWRLADFMNDQPLGGWLIIVNRGDIAAISADDVFVTGVVDDNASAVFTAAPTAEGSVIPAGIAGGLASLPMEPLIEPLVAEPRGDEQSYVEIRAFDLPEGYYDVEVTLTLELDGLSTELPMTFHIEGGLVTWMDPVAAERIEVAHQ